MRRIKPLTKKKARKAIKWFKRRMGLSDWTFRLYIQDDPPDWWGDTESTTAGAVRSYVHAKLATIWVSNARAPRDGSRPIEILFHEAIHVLSADIGLHEVESNHTEFAWTRIGDALADLYEREH